MKKLTLKNYARLIVTVGVNVQAGQEVYISAGVEQPEFVRLVVEAAYQAGAKRVTVDYEDEALTKYHVRYQDKDALAEVPEDQLARWQRYTEVLPCRVYLLSDDPDALCGVDQDKLSAAQARRLRVLKPYRDKMENRYQWCIAAVPGKAWAKKLFPRLRADRAIEALWQAILHAARADGSDPAAAWEAHNRDLHTRCGYLNGLGIASLHYYGSNGTDLRVGMIPEARFSGGSERSLQGVVFNPNLPSEECFISPKRGEAEGIVYATKPLCYQGELIENFWLRFAGGKAVAWGAEKNEALLGSLIGMDEGSAYLGECALVPHDSPISQSGLLFYNTLFDENAACHLALGMGFADTIENFERLGLDQCRALGVNDSVVHEDFMIGFDGLSIDAILHDGTTAPLLRDGLWAF